MRARQPLIFLETHVLYGATRICVRFQRSLLLVEEQQQQLPFFRLAIKPNKHIALVHRTMAEDDKSIISSLIGSVVGSIPDNS